MEDRRGLSFIRGCSACTQGLCNDVVAAVDDVFCLDPEQASVTNYLSTDKRMCTGAALSGCN